MKDNKGRENQEVKQVDARKTNRKGLEGEFKRTNEKAE